MILQPVMPGFMGLENMATLNMIAPSATQLSKKNLAVVLSVNTGAQCLTKQLPLLIIKALAQGGILTLLLSTNWLTSEHGNKTLVFLLICLLVCIGALSSLIVLRPEGWQQKQKTELREPKEMPKKGDEK